MTSGGTAVRVAAEPPASPARVELGPVVALSVSLVLGALFVAGPVLWQVVPMTELPAPFPDTHQDAETLTFILTFALLLPVGIVRGARLADRIAAAPSGGALGSVAALLTAGIGLVVVLTRISTELPWGGGPGFLAGATLLWWVGAVALLVRAVRAEEWPRRDPLVRGERRLWWLAALSAAAAVVCFVDFETFSWPALLVGGGASAVALAAPGRVRLPRPSRRFGLALDGLVVVLLVLAVPNLVVFVTGDPATSYQTVITQFHQDFFLGPANQILHGDAMLVDVLSQYGVGSIYFLTAAFLVLPIGNGTIGLVEGGLSVLMFVGTFATLRMAGVSRLLAAATMTVAVVALVFGLDFPLGALLQHGAIRFGLPVGVIVGAVAESRWPHRRVPARGLLLFTVALAWIWALEAFAYTMLTVAVVVVFQAALLPASGRRSHLRSWASQVVLAGVIAHLLLAMATLAAVGSLPDWGWYLNTLREFLVGSIGDWTYDFSTFSWGLLVGATYVASASALTLLVLRRREVVQRHEATALAIAGMTAWGTALFSYLINRSADHIIPYVSLPAVALGALWLSLAGRSDLGVGAVGRRASLAGALGLATLLVAGAWPSVGTRYSQSALAHAVPGGDTLAGALERLRDRPVIRGASVVGQRMLEEHMPGEDRSIVLTEADLSIEILLRAGRASAVPMGDPVEDSFVPDGHFEPLGDFLDDLVEGDRVLLDRPARDAFQRYRDDPAIDPMEEIRDREAVPSEVAPLQRWVLREMGERFDLRTVGTGDYDLEVVELIPRPNAG